jgi:PAS domain S-box-containing protein
MSIDRLSSRPPDKANSAWLRGGGEMGERIRSLDWEATPIGPMESWSPALRMMVQFLLANRFPMLLWWGPQYVCIYNDPYRPVLGNKHPWALGQPVRTVWSEIWHILQPLIDTPYGGGPSTWNEDIGLELNRHGFVEETHFTIAYSPVPDDTMASGIGGVLATVHEITAKIVGERRVVALRDLGARVGDAKTANEACAVAAQTLSGHSKDVPFALLYLLDESRRHAHLAGASGIDREMDISPEVIDLEAPAHRGWPMTEALRGDGMQIVTELQERFVAVPKGPWTDPPHTAVVMPIPSNRADEPVGLIVAGVSARLNLDEYYKDFLELVRTQIATAIGQASAYEEERKRAEALAEIDRAKTTFFSNVSHEFRTPLTLLVGPIQDGLADQHAPLPPVQRERQEIAHRNALRLLRLVNTLLDFSRIEAGRLDASYEPTDLAALTAELASVFRSAMEKAGLELIVDCPPLPEPVYVDRDMWEKIVLNLLSNAFKFTFDGHIRVELRSHDERVELHVSDTGVGIPASDVPRMFERFHRVRHARARTHEGTGIGLALVQELARLHGGDVSVSSQEGHGTTFTVTIHTGTSHLPPQRISAARQPGSTSATAIPYVEEALRWLPVTSEPAPSMPDPFPSTSEATDVPERQPRVLVADDNADMRDYVSRILGQNYRVDAVADGRAALDRIRAQAPDLVVADVMMPKLDGFGLLAEIRADEGLRALPVVLLSARAGEEARIEGLHAGADEYLVKPFSARDLRATVASQLQLAAVRRESERALRYRSEQYLTILNEAPIGVYLVDANFRIREVNPIALPMFGDIPGGVIGRDFDEVMHLIRERKRADEVVRIFRTTLDTGVSYITPEPVELPVHGEAGGYYEWRLNRITLPDGRFGVVCYFRNVTEQRTAAAAKAHLAAIIDSADDAIIAKDLDGIIQSSNAAAERLFGYTSDELVGRPVRILIPPERQSEEDDILARLRRGERIEHFETVRTKKDGTRLHISLTISPVRDESGKIIGASKIARDITGLRQAEAERIRLLQESSTVMETLNTVGAIVASDLDRSRVVQAVTDAATELTTAEFGAFFYNVVDDAGESYTLYTISGVPRDAFSKFPMPRNTQVFEPTFKGTGIVRSADITKDPRYGHNAPYHGMPPGHLPVRSYLAVPVKGRTGDVIGGLFFGHSTVGRFNEQHERLAVGIASWASVALENARMYMSVQEASRIKDEFLASLSHELRTPLNAILGYARMLRTGIIAPDKKEKAIDTIERNATSLTQIVEDVLDISRIVSGKIRLNVQSVDFPDIVRSAIDAVVPAADAKGVRLESVLDPQASPISGDPERLQQVLWNLLSNAVKFTNRGGRVQVRLERVNSHVEVNVSDTGIGIPPEFLPHVFERFRQADAGIARERGGLGLGLSIARQLIEMHGGTIEASSGGLNQGATFRVRMPLTIVHPVADQLPRVHPRAGTTATKAPVGDLGGVHVLAVDDEPDALSLVTEVLEAVGARVTTARSAQAALSRLDLEVPDVIVADLGMPTLDGFAFIERVRRHSNPRIREVPAAALTAYARSEDRVKALRAGFQIHLAKPIDPAELVTTMAALARRFSGKSPDTVE